MVQSIVKGPGDVRWIRLASDIQLRPIHVVEPVSIKNTEAIADQDVLKPIIQQKTSRANAARTSTIDYDTHRLFRLADQLEGVQ